MALRSLSTLPFSVVRLPRVLSLSNVLHKEILVRKFVGAAVNVDSAYRGFSAFAPVQGSRIVSHIDEAVSAEEQRSPSRTVERNLSEEGESCKPFALFSMPRSVAPSFDVQRLIGNRFWEAIYWSSFEKKYSRKSFLNGATEAAVLCANYLAEGNWGGLRAISVVPVVEELRRRRETLSDKELQMLKFAFEDVVWSFLLSAVIGVKGLDRMFEDGNSVFHGAAVLYIAKDGRAHKDGSPGEVLRKSPPGSVMICNIVLSRAVTPLGPWLITKVNFFDYER